MKYTKTRLIIFGPMVILAAVPLIWSIWAYKEETARQERFIKDVTQQLEAYKEEDLKRQEEGEENLEAYSQDQEKLKKLREDFSQREREYAKYKKNYPFTQKKHEEFWQTYESLYKELNDLIKTDHCIQKETVECIKKAVSQFDHPKKKS